MNTVTILKRARDLLADPAHWTQHTNARNAEGKSVKANSKYATCWCAIGAINKAARSSSKAGHALAPIYDVLLESDESITDVNDYGNHAAVLKLFDAAIAKASQS